MPTKKSPPPPDLKKVVSNPIGNVNEGNGGESTFSRYFKHYLTGVIYDAYDYGHKCWPIGGAHK